MAKQRKKNMTKEEQFIQRVYALRLKNPRRHTPGKATSKADQSPDHLDGQTRIRGNLASGRHIYTFDEGKLQQAYVQSYYAWNAWNYLGSGTDPARNIYQNTRFKEHCFFHAEQRPNFFQLYPTHALGKHQEVYAQYQQEKDPDLKRYYRRKAQVIFLSENLGKRTAHIGVTLPYPWEAHHLLPTNVFYKNLTLDQIKFIIRTNYDINDGRNIIFLPQKKLDTPIHKLPYHSSGHIKYDRQVKTKILQLKETLDNIAQDNLEHPNPDLTMEDTLHKYEAEMFEHIRELGKTPRQPLG